MPGGHLQTDDARKVRGAYMSDNASDDTPDDVSTESSIDLQTTVVTSPYKVLGQLDADNGVGVLGQNDANVGTPIGVQGAVPNNSTGYGLATPDDARIEGTVDTNETDFVVEAGTTNTGNAQNVVMGHASNYTGLALGATVGGGGYNDGGTFSPNKATEDFATVAGGLGNTASADYATVGGGNGNTASGRQTTVGGGNFNTATSGSAYATVSGGTSNVAKERYATVGGGEQNTASDFRATVSGGVNNTASGEGAIVTGGETNTASGDTATVSGGTSNAAKGSSAIVGAGFNNTTSGDYATVGGGISNTASGRRAAVGGGIFNEAFGSSSTIGGGKDNRTGKSGASKGEFATVPGGQNVLARENYAFAAGHNAEALAEGAFVWGDSSINTVQAFGTNEVVFQAGGGVVMWSSSDFNSKVELKSGDNSWTQGSSRTMKSAVEPVDPGEVLTGLETVDVSTWEYDTRPGVRHMGPMAEEFHETFGLGEDERMISSVDADGVALAAIQGLAERLDRKGDRIEDLEAENERKDERIESLETENTELRERVTAVEDRLSNIEGGTPSPATGDD